MHAGLLDVLHDCADLHRLAVAERVHVDLNRVLEEAVDQQHLFALAVGRSVSQGRATRLP